MSSLMTQSEYAAHIGKSKQYVNKLVKQGRIPVNEDGKIDAAEADFALKRNADPARDLARDEGPTAEPTPPRSGGDGTSFAKVRTMREAYQAKMAELQYKKQIGELTDAREADAKAFQLFREVRDKVLALNVRLAGKLAALRTEREVVAFLEDEHYALFDELASAWEHQADAAE